MKKIIYFLIISFSFLFINLDVLAFSATYPYNYEVTRMNKSGDTITVEGWAIMNAGVGGTNYGSAQNGFLNSPPLNISKASGSSSSFCTGDGKTYLYTLYAVPANSNGSVNLANKKLVGNTKPGNGKTNLTAVMCEHTADYKCIKNESACYDNVGFTFSFSESLITNDDNFKYGYGLYLEISKPSLGTPVGFTLLAYKNRMSGFENDQVDYYGNHMLDVIAFSAYYQHCQISGNRGYCESGASHFSGSSGFTTGVSYKLREENAVINYSSYANGVTFYPMFRHANGKWVWAPASWVAPAKGNITIMRVLKTETCSSTSQGQDEQNTTIEACSGNTNFNIGDNGINCSVDTYSYYTQSCKETYDNGKSKLEIIPPFNFGGGVTANSYLKTKYTCTYTFDVDLFMQNYHNALYNIEYYENLINSLDPTDEEYSSKLQEYQAGIYAMKNLIESLKENLNHYLNLTAELSATEWDSGYDFEAMQPILKIEYGSSTTVTEGLVPDEEGFVHTQTDLDGNGSMNSEYCKTDLSRDINFEGSSYTIKNMSCGEEWSVNLELPRVCLNMKTSEMEECRDDGSQLEGGHKYYVDYNESSGNLVLEITKLGHDQKWSVTATTCPFSFSQRNTIFRQIELDDPFLQSYNTPTSKREIGKNYSNSSYNFVNIIKPNIWSSNYFYRFSLSKSNINNIKKDTSGQISKYLGDNCYFDVSDQYICSFIRDRNSVGSNSFFTKVESN